MSTTREDLARLIAVHEAGHAVVALALGLTVERVVCRLEPVFGETQIAKQEQGEPVQIGTGEIPGGRSAGEVQQVPIMLIMPKDPAADGVVALAGFVATELAGLRHGGDQLKDKDNALWRAKWCANLPGEQRSPAALYFVWQATARRLLEKCAAAHAQLTQQIERALLEGNACSIVPKLPEV